MRDQDRNPENQHPGERILRGKRPAPAHEAVVVKRAQKEKREQGRHSEEGKRVQWKCAVRPTAGHHDITRSAAKILSTSSA
jgi:hypothetical protein